MPKLRTGRIRALAKHIEDPKVAKRYDQTRFNNCNTPLCIAGHAVALWGDFQGARDSSNSDFDVQAQEILGLSNRQRVGLFGSGPMLGTRPTRHNAARALRTLAKTGRPDWGTKRLYKRDPLV